ncbi:GAF domain-containing protein [Dysgonomonas capnocytophagoides]|uniref:GAF domain-containing protein n=1 Tax=Dysgonomonas capnocytophagoides TaxID=45254 RepID=A0A4Y8L875_9BACT|nr:GAF domain-containing protein [Dysgonomonas capnocytophagoides]TFD98773.1 GAF domain-containing protein [Dysgonomonas capnocytophagoides]
MAEKLNLLQDVSREEQYKSLLPQIEGLLSGETDMIANMANVSAVLKEAFHFLWVGFYIIKNNQLVLGPFQGKIACTRIAYGKGVCGTAWKEDKIQIVEDVNTFPGHIACDAESLSEIVLPIRINDSIMGVLDIDSEYIGCFSEIDATYLEQIVLLLSRSFV